MYAIVEPEPRRAGEDSPVVGVPVLAAAEELGDLLAVLVDLARFGVREAWHGSEYQPQEKNPDGRQHGAA